MKIKVNVKLNPAAIKKLEQIQKQALEMTADAILSDIKTSAVVPKDTGELERSGFVDISQIGQGKAKIFFDTPYARRLYWHPEYNFRQDKNPNAQGKWMQTYIDEDKEDYAQDTFAEFLRQLGKGLIK